MMARLVGAIGALFWLLGSTAAAGSAAVARPLDLSLSAAAASDYVFRGISQTGGDPQVSGAIDLALGSSAYAGAWVSNVDFSNGTDAEYDLYAGVRSALGAVSVDAGALYYGYVDAPRGSAPDFWEVKVAASAPVGPATLGAAVFYSPEFFGDTGKATYGELSAAAPLGGSDLTLSAAVGRQWVEEAVDYSTWNVGVGLAVTKSVTFDVRYWGTSNGTQLGSAADERVVVGLRAMF